MNNQKIQKKIIKFENIKKNQTEENQIKINIVAICGDLRCCNDSGMESFGRSGQMRTVTS